MDGVRLPDRDGPAAGPDAAFRGALPFPQFLAFIASGIAALVQRAPTAPPPSSDLTAGPPQRSSAAHKHSCYRGRQGPVAAGLPQSAPGVPIRAPYEHGHAVAIVRTARLVYGNGDERPAGPGEGGPFMRPAGPSDQYPASISLSWIDGS
jgi:hypothetical protein